MAAVAIVLNTSAFLKHIESQDEIGTIFRRISSDVYETTKRTQLPELSLSLIGEFYLRGRAADATRPSGAPTDVARADFEAAERVDSVAGWDAFLTRYPDGFYATLARERRSKVANVVAALPTPAEKTTPQVRRRVVLYDEDPNEPQGRQYIGTATWRTESVVTNGRRDIAIRADIDVPTRKLFVTLTIRRNLDPSLPASHTVEMTFRLPPDFIGGSIANVPGVLMKAQEQTRGTPLAGLAVKVTDNFFLVGLSNVDADRSRNLSLLKERGWLDIPLVYANQRRAILAFEKGPSGEAVFAEAFERWGADAAQLSTSYSVQIVSQKSEADARTAYKAMQAKFPNILGSRDPIIRRADLGNQGVYFRANVGPFSAAEEAGQFCNTLKTAGGQCVVQRN